MPQKKIEHLLANALRRKTGRRPQVEYRFTGERMWRFDCAYPRQKLAIEIHGRQHRRAAAMRNDCEKLNAATEMGWTCLVYPAQSVLTEKRLALIVEQIERILCGVADAEAAAHTLTG